MSDLIYTKQHMEVMRDEWKKENTALKEQLKNQNGEFCDPYCFAGIKKDEDIAAMTDKISDYQQEMAVLAGENEAHVKRWEELKNHCSGSAYDTVTDIVDKMNELE